MFKIDKGKFKIIETGEGFLKARISIARPGVFPYTKSDGSISYEAKLPNDLYSKSTMNSIIGAPIADKHPPGEKLITTENYKEYAKGNISNPVINFDTKEIEAIATLYDSELIKKVKANKQNQASIGYTYIPSLENGYYDGEKYDSSDQNIIINHIALEEYGRAGENIKIHLDKKNKEAEIMPKWNVEGNDTSNSFTYRKFDGSTDIQVAAEIHQELMSIKNDSKEKAKEIVALKAEIDSLEKEKEQIKKDNEENADNKELEAKLEIANDKAKEWEKKYDALNLSIPEIVEKSSNEKFELAAFAKSVDPEIKLDGLTNKEIKIQIIAKGLPFKAGIKTDSLTDEIIDARYDAACELLRVKASESKNDNSQNVGVKIDADEIAKKKAALQNIYQTSREVK